MAVRALGFDGLEVGLERGRGRDPLGGGLGVALPASDFRLIRGGGGLGCLEGFDLSDRDQELSAGHGPGHTHLGDAGMGNGIFRGRVVGGLPCRRDGIQ